MVEVVHDSGIDDRQAQLLGVQHLDALCIGVQELEAALVQLTGRTLGHLNDEGGVGVGDFEGAMEELTGVRCV